MTGPRKRALASLALALAPAAASAQEGAAAAVAPTGGAIEPAAAGTGALLGHAAFALLLLAAAGAAHWALRRAERRLPRLLARRARASRGAAAMAPAWQRPLELAFALPKLGVWLTAGWLVSERFAALAFLRERMLHYVGMALTSPVFTLKDKGYSALDVLALPVLLALLWITVSALTRLARAHLVRAGGVERGVQATLLTLGRYLLVFVGAVVILQAWGVDVRSLAILGSVLGVGIGFGLQNIANNFVSGILISLERPVQPGDFLKVGELTGTVQRIGARSTEIRTLDHVTILVPNSQLLEKEVINWSHGDPVCRLHLPVTVAYGSDLARVRAALLESAQGHPEVLKDPRPLVEFHGFGESALEFDLLIWTREPRRQYHLKSDIYFRIEANLRRHGVQVPFPQRDLHLRSPQLDRALRAWTQRQFPELEAERTPELQRPEAPEPFDEELGPRAWPDAELEALVARMRGTGGLAILDRRHLLSLYPRCFVGREAVEWMMRCENLTREDAIAVGERLVERGVIHHVLDEHGFEDGNLFYRFVADEKLRDGA